MGGGGGGGRPVRVVSPSDGNVHVQSARATWLYMCFIHGGWLC